MRGSREILRFLANKLVALSQKQCGVGPRLLLITNRNSQNKGFYCFFFLQSSAVAHTSRVNCDEMVGDRLRQFANRNCCNFLQVSLALAQISLFD